MLHLDTLVLHNFKSFKHASIKFTNGFNCIIGSNGSGKSSICDSLLFALGEGSLKRMHVPSFSYLINSSAKPRPEDNIKRAYVKLTLDGDQQYEIMRIIKSNNKISYRLNGKHVTRQEVLDLLHHYQCEINDTNVITQGEIVSKLDLNAKERRELIDVAAGIKEFDDKKDAALKELGRVEEKINEAHVMLNERMGFLEELRKEKEDAERYLEFTNLLKRANFTILKRRKVQLESEFEHAARSLSEKSAQLASIEKSMKELDMKIEKASSDKQSILNALNARSAETSAASKALEELNKNIAVLEEGMKNSDVRLSELESRLEALSKEKKSITDELMSGKLLIDSLSKELEGKASKLSILEPKEQGSSSAAASAYSEKQKLIYELSARKESLIGEKALYESKLHENSDAAKRAEAEVKKIAESIALAEKELSGKSEKLGSIIQSMSAKGKELEELKLLISQTSSKIDGLYRQSVDIRESIAVHGNTDHISPILKQSVKGFYGRAEELCTYDEKYSTAVQAAASGRLGYFVVESISDAAASIKILKDKNLGRASFIPINEVVVKGSNAEISGATPMLSYIKFDKKYEKAFQYIFSGTYLVNDIEAARRIGIGKCRFVTISGEVIELAGIISGGSSKESYIQLGAKLKSIESEKAQLEKKLNSSNDKLNVLSKELAALQIEQITLQESTKSIKSAIEHDNAVLKSMQELSSSSMLQMSEYSNKLESVITSISSTESEIAKLKQESDSLYAVVAHAHSGSGHASASELNELRSSIESLKIKIATKAKEREMLSNRLASLDGDIASVSEESRKLRQEKANAVEKLATLHSDASELQEKIKTHDEKSAGIYKQMQELDDSIAQMAQQRGRFSSDSEKLRRDTFSIESSKAQAETKLNDIKAELLSYNDMQELDKSTDELEKQSIIWKSEIEKLGAVNLKAPEIYEQKSRDVNEARQKVSTLSSEKDSIIAMMNEIDSKKLSVFLETFKEVNENFQKLYGYAFEDSAYLELENSKDPFDSGLVIKVKGNGSKDKPQIAPSGGEKSLHLLMLIFAIQMCKPMSYYIFDEIDVSLDKENTKKLSMIIKQLSAKSQMIIVSHNDNMIIAADTAIGVAKSNGESKAFGLEVSELKAREQQAPGQAGSQQQ